MRRLIGLAGAMLVGVLFAGAESAQALTNGDILMINGSQVLQVDPDTGDRVLISGCTDGACSSLRGSGPMFSCDDGDLEIEATGAILVTAYHATEPYDAIFRIDPATGDRTIVSSLEVGTGPGATEGTFRGLAVFHMPPTVASMGTLGLICLGVCLGLMAKRATVNSTRES